jgi:hypothetical protein
MFLHALLGQLANARLFFCKGQRAHREPAGNNKDGTQDSSAHARQNLQATGLNVLP